MVFRLSLSFLSIFACSCLLSAAISSSFGMITYDAHASVPNDFKRPSKLPINLSASFSSCQSDVKLIAERLQYQVVSEETLLRDYRRAMKNESNPNLWEFTRIPISVARLMERGAGRYYVNVVIPPIPHLDHGIDPTISIKIDQLTSLIHENAPCVQTLRVEILRTGPISCTYWDPWRGRAREIQVIDTGETIKPVLGLDFCD